MESRKPRIGITLGDVAGIGPEVSVKVLASPHVEQQCLPIFIGERSVLEHYVGRVLPGRPVQVIDDPETASEDATGLYLVDLKNLAFADVRLGEIQKECGKAALDFIRAGVELCLAKKLDAMVTAPIHKEAAQLGGLSAPGHTEFLAELCGVQEVRMLLVVNHLRAMHITTHLSLKAALACVKKERILETIHFATTALEQLGIEKGRIAVAGLNPHAGENGMFGDEEIREVAPAVEAARREGLAVWGPIAPDTVFHRMNQGEFDLVVALYHDQGHIPLKLIGFDSGVNVTIGLPIIRTSADHGTAFDIAGKLVANPDSMIKAVDLACSMSRARSGRTA
ncbi:MAG: 4-hydroxythreonine-4-phosphate dehydrogenase PdxA [Acidobacteriota bacterium]